MRTEKKRKPESPMSSSYLFALQEYTRFASTRERYTHLRWCCNNAIVTSQAFYEIPKKPQSINRKQVSVYSNIASLFDSFVARTAVSTNPSVESPSSSSLVTHRPRQDVIIFDISNHTLFCSDKGAVCCDFSDCIPSLAILLYVLQYFEVIDKG
jgi:hypothetical protein